MAKAETLKIPELWKASSKFLEQLSANSELYKDNYKEEVKSFYSNLAPKISISDYVSRIYKYTNCSESCIILALIYIEKITKKINGITLNRFTIHR